MFLPHKINVDKSCATKTENSAKFELRKLVPQEHWDCLSTRCISKKETYTCYLIHRIQQPIFKLRIPNFGTDKNLSWQKAAITNKQINELVKKIHENPDP